MRQISNHWIQKADFSPTDFGEADQFKVFELFRGHPWPEEIRLLNELEAKGEDCCPPGLGLNATNADILHICAVGSEKWMVHFHYSETYKILGLIPSTRNKFETSEDVSTQQAETMIAQFFAGKRVAPA